MGTDWELGRNQNKVLLLVIGREIVVRHVRLIFREPWKGENFDVQTIEGGWG